MIQLLFILKAGLKSPRVLIEILFFHKLLFLVWGKALLVLCPNTYLRLAEVNQMCYFKRLRTVGTEWAKNSSKPTVFCPISVCAILSDNHSIKKSTFSRNLEMSAFLLYENML